MRWIFEGSRFVVQDLRATFDKIVSPGFPFNWTGKEDPYNIGPRRIEHVIYRQTYSEVTRGIQGPLELAHMLTDNPWFECPECGYTWEGKVKYPFAKCPKDGTKGKDLRRGKGQPKIKYHVFVPFKPQFNEKGKAIIYYLVDFKEGKGNGVVVGFQGRFASRHMTRFTPSEGTDGQPSEVQKELAVLLWKEWLNPLFKFNDISKLTGGFDHGKAASPGDCLEGIIRKLRGDEEQVQEPPDLPPLPEAKEEKSEEVKKPRRRRRPRKKPAE